MSDGAVTKTGAAAMQERETLGCLSGSAFALQTNEKYSLESILE